jgi:hypothetical protein
MAKADKWKYFNVQKINKNLNRWIKMNRAIMKTTCHRQGNTGAGPHMKSPNTISFYGVKYKYIFSMFIPLSGFRKQMLMKIDRWSEPEHTLKRRSWVEEVGVDGAGQDDTGRGARNKNRAGVHRGWVTRTCHL